MTESWAGLANEVRTAKSRIARPVRLLLVTGIEQHSNHQTPLAALRNSMFHHVRFCVCLNFASGGLLTYF